MEYVNQESGERDEHTRLTFKPVSGTLPIDDNTWKLVSSDMQTNFRFDVWEGLLLDAKLHLLRNDNRMAAINAAIVVETVVTRFLTKQLKGTASPSQVDKFVREVSRRDLVIVGLGLVSNIAMSVRKACFGTLELRNAILHAPKRVVTSEEANQAVDSVEALLGACLSNISLEAKCPQILDVSSFDSLITRTHS